MSELNVSSGSEEKKSLFRNGLVKTVYALLTAEKYSIFDSDEWELLLDRWDQTFVEGSDMTGRQTFWWNFVGKCNISPKAFGQADVDTICDLVQKSKQQQIEQGDYVPDVSVSDFVQKIFAPDKNAIKSVVMLLVKEGFLKE